MSAPNPFERQQPSGTGKLEEQLHSELIESLDMRRLEGLPKEQVRIELRRLLEDQINRRALPLNRFERENVLQAILDDVTGLGPLEALLRDPHISDILVNNPNQTWVERKGKLELAPIRFRDSRHLLQVIQRIVTAVGRRVDESSPMVDARLPDGSRVNAIIMPLALDGPVLCIRRFGNKVLEIDDLIAHNALTPTMAAFLRAAVSCKLNVLISGGTGTGKTTLLNCLSGFIPEHERVITIEDAAELRLRQPHVVRLETRPANLEGKGEVNQRDLVKNALRMRPDRVILGEVRGAEVLDMLQAMNTGHEGSMATVHANTPADAMTRLSYMIGLTGVPLSEAMIAQSIGRAIHMVVQLVRQVDGVRRITAISEVGGVDGANVLTNDVFAFRQEGIDEQGKVFGKFVRSRNPPQCLDKLLRAGVRIEELSPSGRWGS